VVVLGAGGAGRVAALKLAAEGVRELCLINRTRTKAESLGREIGRHFPQVTVLLDYPDHAVDLVLNATALGLRAEDASPLDEQRLPLPRVGAVYDMIYRPAETPLLRRAKKPDVARPMVWGCCCIKAPGRSNSGPANRRPWP